jgi:pSer/pThr/pTyr-binding forkhead associated (FHA) protein
MKPLGGGDPVPLLKTELTVGRRPSCDIILDFENVSGKHCKLRYLNQVWHVRDLGSTNGTSINGAVLSSEHSIMPDDELSIASHIFTIDYEPGAPSSVLMKEGFLDDEVIDAPKRTSLMELAGLDTDDDRPSGRKSSRPTKAPTDPVERRSADEADFADTLPSDVKATPAPIIDASDDDFFKLIEEDVSQMFKKDEK